MIHKIKYAYDTCIMLFSKSSTLTSNVRVLLGHVPYNMRHGIA